MMCAVALRLKIAGHVWKTVKFLDFRIHGESFISRLPLSSDGLLSCGCVQSNPRSLLQSNSRLLCVSFYLRFQEKTLMTIPWTPEAFHARFPVSVKSKKSDPREFFLAASPFVSSACGRRNSSSHARKHLWRPGYDDKDFLQFFNVSSLFTK